MTIEHHPRGFDFRARYPDARRVAAGEGESCYAATDGSDGVLITDSGTLADLLDQEDRSLCGVSVRRFSTVAKRDEYLADLLAGRRREDDAY